MKKLLACALLLATGSAHAFFDFAIGEVTDNGDGSATLSTGGAAVSDTAIENFALLPLGTLDSLVAGNATEGSAADAFVTLAAGDTVTLDWVFTTNEFPGTGTFTDFAFSYIFADDAELIANTMTVDPMTGVDSGTISFTNIGFGGTIGLFIGGGVMDVADTVVDSTLELGNLQIVPAPATLLLLGLGLVGLGAARRRA